MEEYLSDSDPLAILAEEIRSLKEEVKKSNVVPQVQQEQKQRDQSDMRKALLEIMDKVRIPAPRVQLPDGATQALDDFNKNYRSINRRPLVGNRTAKLILYGALVLTLTSSIFGIYSYVRFWCSKDAYARRAYYATKHLGAKDPGKAYDLVQEEWSEDRRLVKARVRHLEKRRKESISNE